MLEVIHDHVGRQTLGEKCQEPEREMKHSPEGNRNRNDGIAGPRTYGSF